MQLTLERSRLREWEAGDARSLVRHADSYAVWRTLRDRFPRPYTREDAERWIRLARSCAPPTQLAIVVSEEAVGGIGLTLGEDVYRHTAELGYWLGESHWGRGIMTEAVQAFTEWAFDTFDLNRIAAHVFEQNTASKRVLEKCGYQLEGRLRAAVVKEGVLLDEWLYASVRRRDRAR